MPAIREHFDSFAEAGPAAVFTGLYPNATDATQFMDTTPERRATDVADAFCRWPADLRALHPGRG